MQRFYHGLGKSGPYFEGWYVKLQAPDGQTLALIPAVHIDAKGKRSASLQVITSERSWWVDYPAAVFRASPKRFFVRLGQNLFTENGLSLRVKVPGLQLEGCLQYGPMHPLPSDIMGPFRFLGDMECAHGVLSMWHTLQGKVTCNGKTTDFSGGVGYIETDRGRSFPSEYFWTQCAWKDTAQMQNSLMLAVAEIPLWKLRFTGCIGAVQYQGKVYQLATYRGAKVERWSRQGAAIRQGKYRIEAVLLQSHGHSLRAPKNGNMGRSVTESVDAMVRYRFWYGGRLLMEHTDLCAGFEYSRAGFDQ